MAVLLTTHGSPHLADALGSVLAQGMADLELVVVDDASTDGTAALLAATRDPRLRVLRTPRRSGVVAARNFGLAAVRAPLVAMLDHDDLCHPDRLALQARAMEADARLVLCGGAVLVAGRGRSILGHEGAAGPALVRWMLHLGNPFAWSSVMVRTAALRRLGTPLRAEYELADDLDLYHRLLEQGEAVRLGEVLATYRWHAANTSHARRPALTRAAERVLARACGVLLGPGASAAEAMQAATLLVRHVSDREPADGAAALQRLGVWLDRLLARFLATPGLSEAERDLVRAHAAATWWDVVRAAARSGRPGLLRLRHAFPALRGRVPAAALGGTLAVGLLRAGRPRRREP